MKQTEIIKLKEGEKVFHSHYGTCTVKRGTELGPIIIPDSPRERILLSIQSGMPPKTPLLEDNLLLIKRKVPNDMNVNITEMKIQEYQKSYDFLRAKEPKTAFDRIEMKAVKSVIQDLKANLKKVKDGTL